MRNRWLHSPAPAVAGLVLATTFGACTIALVRSVNQIQTEVSRSVGFITALTSLEVNLDTVRRQLSGGAAPVDGGPLHAPLDQLAGARPSEIDPALFGRLAAAVGELDATPFGTTDPPEMARLGDGVLAARAAVASLRVRLSGLSQTLGDRWRTLTTLLAISIGFAVAASALLFALQRSSKLIDLSQARYRLLADSLDDVVSLHALDGTVLHASDLTAHGETAVHAGGDALSAEERHAIVRDLHSAALGDEVDSRESTLHLEGREPRTIETRCRVIHDESGTPYLRLCTSRDITLRRQAQDQVERLAFYDVLTGLPNRRLLLDRLDVAIRSAAAADLSLAVVALDLDRFKVMSDALGSTGGDLLLRDIATRLAASVPAGATVGRTRGDEFLFIFPRVGDIAEADRLANQVLSALAKPFRIAGNGRDLFVSASLGASLFPEHGSTPLELVRTAETAVTSVKRAGRTGYRRYQSQMDTDDGGQFELESDLHRALARGQLELHFQPVLTVASRELVGFEALIRWRHPERGLLGADDFLPIAEETGLILPIGRWSLSRSIAAACAWRQAGHPGLRVALNLSTRQLLHAGLVESVRDALAANGANPDCLELELTETYAMANVDVAEHVMHQLGALGVRLALDDFGTGHSSLAYLRRLPIHTLKVDRMFIQDLHKSPQDAAIAGTIIGLGHALDLRVIAEGIESDDQLEVLRRLGCDDAQGYLFSPALPAGDVPAYLAAHQARRSS